MIPFLVNPEKNIRIKRKKQEFKKETEEERRVENSLKFFPSLNQTYFLLSPSYLSQLIPFAEKSNNRDLNVSFRFVQL